MDTIRDSITSAIEQQRKKTAVGYDTTVGTRRPSSSIEDRRGRVPPQAPDQRKAIPVPQSEQRARPDQLPPWMGSIGRRPPGAPYETGDGEIDTYLKSRAMERFDRNSPYADAYRDPGRAQEMLKNYYDAGRYRDKAAEQQLSRSNDPFARLLRRAYQDGWRKGQPRS